jgi:hypothetical protein
MKVSLLASVGALTLLVSTGAAAQDAAPGAPGAPPTPADAPLEPASVPVAKPPPVVEVTVPDGCVLRPDAQGVATLYCLRQGATSPEGQPGAAPTRRWYGGYVLAVDGASVLVGLTGVLLPPMVMVGVAGYVLGAPIVHWYRGHTGKGFASLGLRVGAITAGSVAGFALAEPRCKGDFAGLCALFYVVPLVASGMVAASAVDAALLAREDVKPPPGEARRAPPTKRPAFTMVPTLAITPTVQQAGVAGTF